MFTSYNMLSFTENSDVPHKLWVCLVKKSYEREPISMLFPQCLLEIVELLQSLYSALEASSDAAVKSSSFAAVHVTASYNVFDVTGTLGMDLRSSLLDF